MSSKRKRLAIPEWLAAAFTILFVQATVFRKLIYHASIGDAVGFQSLARSIRDGGLFNIAAYNPLVTYGYPLFLTPLAFLERLTSIPMNWLAAEFQTAIYLFAIWLLRNELLRISPRLARWVFIALSLNIFVLGYIGETLSESLTIIVILFVASCWLWLLRVYRSRRWMLAVAVGSLLSGYAVMVRPGNLYLPIAWMVGLAALILSRRIGPRAGELWRRAAIFALPLILIPLPCLPQLRNNMVFAKVTTPLLGYSLPSLQLWLGIRHFKIIWGVPPIMQLAIGYENPFAVATWNTVDEKNPLPWYFHHPKQGLETILLHEFALVDDDYLFTYLVDLFPPYRIPVTIVNHAMLGFAAYAILLWFRPRQFASRARPILRVSLLIALAYMAGMAVIYGGAQVEIRYGLPLMLIAVALSAGGLLNFSRLSGRHFAVVAIAVTLYTCIGVVASGWTRDRSPYLHKMEHAPK